jgi:DNA-binding transcriptional MerR regulator
MSMDKGYLSIGEVLSLLQDEFPDITISKIRFLESQGLIDPERTPSGYRKFYEVDLDRLRFILREQKDHFLPLRVIKDRLDDGEIGAPPSPTPSPNHPTQRVPVWMAEAKAKTLATPLAAAP